MPTRSYLSQVELPVTFGLGAFAGPVRVRVIWPNGEVQDLAEVAVDELVVVTRQPD